MNARPAHHVPRSWQDFLLHLLTITIDPFIAPTLQAGVESQHHRHLKPYVRAKFSLCWIAQKRRA